MASLAFTASKSVAAHKANGAMKTVFGTFTFDTDYPDDGYTEAALLALAGLSPYLQHNIYAIIPISQVVSGSGETGNVAGWDPATSTLRIFEGGADGDPMDEIPTGENLMDGATLFCMIYGN